MNSGWLGAWRDSARSRRKNCAWIVEIMFVASILRATLTKWICDDSSKRGDKLQRMTAAFVSNAAHAKTVPLTRAAYNSLARRHTADHGRLG
jgi:hypothetical protein